MPREKQVFLSAEWRNLAMLNYEIDPELLNQYVPPGTTLDSFGGKTYISLVCFQFRDTRLFGRVRIPFHTDFDEVNLRFYVRRKNADGDRRGVVFIAEIVPKWAVAQLARLVYGENYLRHQMKHDISMDDTSKTVQYAFRLNGS